MGRIAPGTIYMLDLVDATRGREEPYAASAHSLTTGAMGETATLQFRSPGAAGSWPCVVNLWERPWAEWMHTCATRFGSRSRDHGVDQWWRDNEDLRSGGWDVVMLPSAGTPGFAELPEAVGACDVVAVDLVEVPASATAGYLDAADRVLASALAEAGGALVGAYRVLWRPNLVVTVLALPGHADVERVLAGPGPWPEIRSAAATRTRTHVLVPVRSNPGRS